MTDYRTFTVDDVDRYEQDIEETVEGWFLDEPLSRDDFIDRLEQVTVRDGVVFASSWDDVAIKRVLSIARRVKRELNA